MIENYLNLKFSIDIVEAFASNLIMTKFIFYCRKTKCWSAILVFFFHRPTCIIDCKKESSSKVLNFIFMFVVSLVSYSNICIKLNIFICIKVWIKDFFTSYLIKMFIWKNLCSCKVDILKKQFYSAIFIFHIEVWCFSIIKNLENLHVCPNYAIAYYL